MTMENPPGDWAAPDWEDAPHVNDWKGYISKEVQEMWTTFTAEQKQALARQADYVAIRQPWY